MADLSWISNVLAGDARAEEHGGMLVASPPAVAASEGGAAGNRRRRRGNRGAARSPFALAPDQSRRLVAQALSPLLRAPTLHLAEVGCACTAKMPELASWSGSPTIGFLRHWLVLSEEWSRLLAPLEEADRFPPFCRACDVAMPSMRDAGAVLFHCISEAHRDNARRWKLSAGARGRSQAPPPLESRQASLFRSPPQGRGRAALPGAPGGAGGGEASTDRSAGDWGAAGNVARALERARCELPAAPMPAGSLPSAAARPALLDRSNWTQGVPRLLEPARRLPAGADRIVDRWARYAWEEVQIYCRSNGRGACASGKKCWTLAGALLFGRYTLATCGQIHFGDRESVDATVARISGSELSRWTSDLVRSDETYLPCNDGRRAGESTTPSDGWNAGPPRNAPSSAQTGEPSTRPTRARGGRVAWPDLRRTAPALDGDGAPPTAPSDACSGSSSQERFDPPASWPRVPLWARAGARAALELLSPRGYAPRLSDGARRIVLTDPLSLVAMLSVLLVAADDANATKLYAARAGVELGTRAGGATAPERRAPEPGDRLDGSSLPSQAPDGLPHPSFPRSFEPCFVQNARGSATPSSTSSALPAPSTVALTVAYGGAMTSKADVYVWLTALHSIVHWLRSATYLSRLEVSFRSPGVSNCTGGAVLAAGAIAEMWGSSNVLEREVGFAPSEGRSDATTGRNPRLGAAAAGVRPPGATPHRPVGEPGRRVLDVSKFGCPRTYVKCILSVLKSLVRQPPRNLLVVRFVTEVSDYGDGQLDVEICDIIERAACSSHGQDRVRFIAHLLEFGREAAPAAGAQPLLKASHPAERQRHEEPMSGRKRQRPAVSSSAAGPNVPTLSLLPKDPANMIAKLAVPRVEIKPTVFFVSET